MRSLSQRRRMSLHWLVLAALLLTLSPHPTSAHPSSMEQLRQQTLVSHVPATLRATVFDHYERNMIKVKFRDQSRLRLRNAQIVDIDNVVGAAAVDAVQQAALGGVWQRHQSVDEIALDQLRAEAEANSGRQLPDLNNYVRLELAPSDDAIAAIARFEALPVVERAMLIEKPLPAPADVPDYTKAGAITGNVATDRYQRYLDAAPNGIDARYAWQGNNGSGAGVKICDVEYNINFNHSDINPITLLGPTPDPTQNDNHGTAVMGVVGGKNNGIGVKGIAYGATLYFASADTAQNGYDVAAAIQQCMTTLTTGDIIILEQQIRGPNFVNGQSGCFGCVPVEWNKENYDTIVTAIAKDLVVVEAGANGSQDLDGSEYQTGNGGHYPFRVDKDSGAIIVGGGRSPFGDWGSPARSAASYSNYGATVDLQGWGGGVVTTGYGDFFPGDNPPDTGEKNLWYRRSFAGTSSASPVVAGAAALLQSTYKAVNGTAATPAQIKQILRDTGTPQTGTKQIGPLPDLRAAILSVLGNNAPIVPPPVMTPAPGTYQMPLQVSIAYGTNMPAGNRNLRYTLNGSEPTEDSFIFIPEQGDTIYLNYGVTLKAKAFVYDPTTQRVYESETATSTYSSSTPKVAMPVIAPGEGTYNQGQQFTLSTTTPGATIRYRTDGRAISFFYPGTEYTGPITLSPGEYEITARGYKDGYYKSDVLYSGDIVINEIVLPSPTIYPNGGNFNGSITIYMGSTVLGASIRYTLDGSTPTTSSSEFVEPIELTSTTTVKARVFLEGYTPSEVVEKTFNITQQAQPPTINPNGGEFTDSVEVSLSSPNSGATIRYTTNGAEPTSYSTAYSGPFTLGVGEHTVKAKAFLGNATPSTTTSADFTVYSPITEQVQAPTIDPNGGNHTEAVTVTLRTDTEGATIKYTFDIFLPEEQWTTYGAPFVLTDDPNPYVIRAKAYKSGMADSDFAQTSFNVFTPVGTVEPPDITPPPGIYNNDVTVTVDGHTNPPFTVRQLHITTDGSDPMPGSNTSGVSSPRQLTISASTTVKARATQLAYYDSAVAEASYFLQCATPQLTAGGVYSGSVAVDMSTATENATIRYTTDGSAVTQSSPLYASTVNLGQGTTTVNARCFKTGYAASDTATAVYNVIAPPTAPTVTAPPAPQAVQAGGDVTFTVAYTGFPAPDVQWQFEGKDLAGEIEPVLVIPNAQSGNVGSYQAVVRNSDGQVTTPSVDLTVSGTPVSGLAVDSSSPTPQGNPTFFAATISGGSDVSYAWDFGDGNVGTGQTISHTYAAVGVYTATVTASNSFNSEVAQAVVTVTESAVAIAGLAAENSSPTQLGNPTFFAATITAGSDVSYLWDFGDGASGSGRTVNHTYGAVGNYVVTVTASNSLGNAVAQTAVTVQADAAAVSGLSAENSSPTPLGNPTFFAATITGGTDVSYAWDFGDGASGTGQTVSHTYAIAGIYTATVTASNSVGSASAQTSVTVREVIVDPTNSIYLPLIQR